MFPQASVKVYVRMNVAASSSKLGWDCKAHPPEVGASNNVYGSTYSLQLSEYHAGTSPKSPNSSHGVSGG